ncbi:MAG: gamma-glutamyltransferase [Actinomycetota bacterium]|nr:gamma-glutamyltransferase [Actinomycetota bacterium]
MNPTNTGLPFHSFERIATANHGIVCSSQPLASEAGLTMLKAGGNAFDAGLAAAAVLAVVEPAASHLGGDVFVVCHAAQDGRAYAVNGSGGAPQQATAAQFPNGIPLRGPRNVTVPGAVAAWCDVSHRWGSLPLGDVLAAAIDYARIGFPLGHRMATQLAENREVLVRYSDSRAQFVDGNLSMGAIVQQPHLAATLEAIADQGAAGF